MNLYLLIFLKLMAIFLVNNDLDLVIEKARPDVMVDFTNPQAVFNNAKLL